MLYQTLSDPWEGQESALCLGEKQSLCMNSGKTHIHSEVTNAAVHTQKKSRHCTFVSCSEWVTQLQPPLGLPAPTQKLYSSIFSFLLFHTEIVQLPLQVPPFPHRDCTVPFSASSFSPGAPLPFPQPHPPLFACICLQRNHQGRETFLPSIVLTPFLLPSSSEIN